MKNLVQAAFMFLIIAALIWAVSTPAQPVDTNSPPQKVDLKNPAIDPDPAGSLMPGRTNRHKVESPAPHAVEASVAANPQPIKLQSTPPPAETPQPTAPSFADGVRLGIIAKQRNIDVNDLNALIQFANMYWIQERQQAAQQQRQQSPIKP